MWAGAFMLLIFRVGSYRKKRGVGLRNERVADAVWAPDVGVAPLP